MGQGSFPIVSDQQKVANKNYFSARVLVSLSCHNRPSTIDWVTWKAEMYFS